MDSDVAGPRIEGAGIDGASVGVGVGAGIQQVLGNGHGNVYMHVVGLRGYGDWACYYCDWECTRDTIGIWGWPGLVMALKLAHSCSQLIIDHPQFGQLV